MSAKLPIVLAAVLVSLGCADDRAGSTDRSGMAGSLIALCQVTDRSGGRNLLAIALLDGRVQSLNYRRSGDLLTCEIEASRRPSTGSGKQSEWVDDGNQSDVVVRYDELEVAHLQIVRRGPQFEIRMVDYDRSELCGTGREFLPTIAIAPGNPTCHFGP